MCGISLAPPGELDFVVHAAAPTISSDVLDPGQLFGTLVDGTRNVLAFARERSVRKFLYVSPGAVYGPQPETMTHIPEGYTGGTGLAESGLSLCGR